MSRSARRHAVLLASALSAAGCHTFVLREEPLTPEPAPVTRVDVVGADTTFVLRASGYALLSRDRRMLWSRATLDDASQRYHWLVGAAPPAIAVRVDSAPAAATPAATATEWEGLPLVTVAATPPDPKRAVPGEAPAYQVPQVAVRAAGAWVRALALPTTAWWFEAGAVRLVADPNARVSAVAQAADAGDRTSLAALLSAPRLAPDAAAVVAPGRPDYVPADGGTTYGGTPGGGYGGAYGTVEARRNRARSVRRDPRAEVRGPLVAAQAAALLLFLRDRDPAFVAELPARLRAGETLPALLARSAALPHTAEAFDTEWRKWLKARPARSREARPRY